MDIIPYTVKPRQDTGLWNAKLGIWLFLASEVLLFGGLFATYIVLRVTSPDWPQGREHLNIPIGTFNTAILIGSSITVVLAWASLVKKNFSAFRLYMLLTIIAGLAFLVVKLAKEWPDKFSHHGVVLKEQVVINGVQFHEGDALSGHLEESKDEKTVVLVADDRTIKLMEKRGHSEGKVEAGAHGDHGPTLHIGRASIKRGPTTWGPWYHTYFAIYFTLTGLHGLHVLGGTIVNFYFWGPGSRMWKTDPKRFTNRVEVTGLFWHFVDLVWIFLFPVFYLL